MQLGITGLVPSLSNVTFTTPSAAVSYLPSAHSMDELIQLFKEGEIIDENLECYLLSELNTLSLDEFELQRLHSIFDRPHKFKTSKGVVELPLKQFLNRLFDRLQLPPCRIEVVGSYVWKILGIEFIKKIFLKCGLDYDERISPSLKEKLEERISQEPHDVDIRIYPEGYESYESRSTLLDNIRIYSEEILGAKPDIHPVKNNPDINNPYLITGFGDGIFTAELLWIESKKLLKRSHLCVRDNLLFELSSVNFLCGSVDHPVFWHTSDNIGKVVFDRVVGLITIRNYHTLEARTLGKIVRELVKGSWIHDEEMRCNLFANAVQSCQGDGRALSAMLISNAGHSKLMQLQMVAVAFKYLHLYFRDKTDVFFLENFLQACLPNPFSQQLIKFTIFPTSSTRLQLMEALAAQIYFAYNDNPVEKFMVNCWFIDDATLLTTHPLYQTVKENLKKYISSPTFEKLELETIYKLIIAQLIKSEEWIRTAWSLFNQHVKSSKGNFLIGCANCSLSETLTLVKEKGIEEKELETLAHYLIKILKEEIATDREKLLKFPLDVLISYLRKLAASNLEKTLKELERSQRFDELLGLMIKQGVMLPQELALKVFATGSKSKYLLPQVLAVVEKGRFLTVDNPVQLLQKQQGKPLFFRLGCGLVLNDTLSADYFLSEFCQRKELYEKETSLIAKLRLQTAHCLELCTPSVVLEKNENLKQIASFVTPDELTRFFISVPPDTMLEAIERLPIDRTYLYDYAQNLIDLFAEYFPEIDQKNILCLVKVLANFLITLNPDNFIKELSRLEPCSFYSLLIKSVSARKLEMKCLMFIFINEDHGPVLLPKVIDHLEKMQTLELSNPFSYLKPHAGTSLFFRLALCLPWTSCELVTYIWEQCHTYFNSLDAEKSLQGHFKKRFLVVKGYLSFSSMLTSRFYKDKEDQIDLITDCGRDIEEVELLVYQLLKEIKADKYNPKNHHKKILLFCRYPIFNLKIWTAIFCIVNEGAPGEMKEELLLATFRKLPFDLRKPESEKLAAALVQLLLHSKKPYLYQLAQTYDLDELFSTARHVNSALQPDLVIQALLSHKPRDEDLLCVVNFLHKHYERSTCKLALVNFFFRTETETPIWICQEALKLDDKTLFKTLIQYHKKSTDKKILSFALSFMKLLPRNLDTTRFYRDVFSSDDCDMLFRVAAFSNHWENLAQESFLAPYFERLLSSDYLRYSPLPDMKKFFETPTGVQCHLKVLEQWVRQWVKGALSYDPNSQEEPLTGIVEVMKRFKLPSLRPEGVAKLIQLSDLILNQILDVFEVERVLALALCSTKGQNSHNIQELLKVFYACHGKNVEKKKGLYLRLIADFTDCLEDRPSQDSLFAKSYKALSSFFQFIADRTFELDLKNPSIQFERTVIRLFISGLTRKPYSVSDYVNESAVTETETEESYKAKSICLHERDSRYNNIIVITGVTKINTAIFTKQDKNRFEAHFFFMIEQLLELAQVDFPVMYDALDTLHHLFMEATINLPKAPLVGYFDKLINLPLRHEEMYKTHMQFCGKIYGALQTKGFYKSEYPLFLQHTAILDGGQLNDKWSAKVEKEDIKRQSAVNDIILQSEAYYNFDKNKEALAFCISLLLKDLFAKIDTASLGYEAYFLTFLRIYGNFPTMMMQNYSSIPRTATHVIHYLLTKYPHLVTLKSFDVKFIVQVLLPYYNPKMVDMENDILRLDNCSSFLFDCYKKSGVKLPCDVFVENPVALELKILNRKMVIGTYDDDYRKWVEDVRKNIVSVMKFLKYDRHFPLKTRKEIFALLLRLINLQDDYLLSFKTKILKSYNIIEFGYIKTVIDMIDDQQAKELRKGLPNGDPQEQVFYLLLIKCFKDLPIHERDSFTQYAISSACKSGIIKKPKALGPVLAEHNYNFDYDESSKDCTEDQWLDESR